MEHLHRAVEVNGALRAPALRAHAEVDLARALGDGPRAAALLAAAAERHRLPLVARRAAAARAGAPVTG